MAISCLGSHSDGTHSLQRIHCWASDVRLNFSKSVNKHLHLGWPDGELGFSKCSSNSHFLLFYRLRFVFGQCALQALDLVDQRSVTCVSSPSGRKAFQVGVNECLKSMFSTQPLNKNYRHFCNQYIQAKSSNWLIVKECYYNCFISCEIIALWSHYFPHFKHYGKSMMQHSLMIIHKTACCLLLDASPNYSQQHILLS